MNPVSPVRKEDIHHKTSKTKPLKPLSSELSNGVRSPWQKILLKNFLQGTNREIQKNISLSQNGA